MNAASMAPAAAGKYLTVTLADESYGIAALKVREIIRLQRITSVPQMPDYVKGVINLRGRVVPVVDLRLRFGLPAATGDRTCIVVVQVQRAARAPLVMGLVVDGVEEVVHFSAEDVSAPPAFGAAVNTDYLLGMARVKDRVKALLDLDRVLTPDGLEAVAASA